MAQRTCSIEGCERVHHCKGMCRLHFQRLVRTGTTDARIAPTLEQRFWAKVEKTDTCWNWTGAISSVGYGRLSVNEYPRYAHRISYEMHVGPIPAGMQVDHLCRNRACVNPAHLEVVSQRENIIRGTSPAAKAAHRRTCLRGHLLTAETTYITRQGARVCRKCRREWGSAYRARKRDAK